MPAKGASAFALFMVRALLLLDKNCRLDLNGAPLLFGHAKRDSAVGSSDGVVVDVPGLCREDTLHGDSERYVTVSAGEELVGTSDDGGDLGHSRLLRFGSAVRVARLSLFAFAVPTVSVIP